MPLYPPPNFNCVDSGVYRSASPTEVSYQFIASLRLKSIVLLSADSCDDKFLSWLEESDIEIVYIEGSSTTISEEMVVRALAVLLDKSKLVRRLPTMHTCMHAASPVVTHEKAMTLI
jgi:Tyrosine phosphatase family